MSAKRWMHRYEDRNIRRFGRLSSKSGSCNWQVDLNRLTIAHTAICEWLMPSLAEFTHAGHPARRQRYGQSDCPSVPVARNARERHGTALKARVAFGAPDQEILTPPETALERRYALRSVKQRLHQASFREAVISAYNGRCALSGLPEPLLLDAAHIIADKHELLGQPVVPNGIPLSKIHHAAFDTHLIGIDPDYRLHVSERLLGQKDGPMLEALKRLDGVTIHLPTRVKDRPDRDRLALRFERFRAVA